MRKINHVNDGKVLATDMIVDKTDVENYVKKLNEEKKSLDPRDSSPIPDLYKAVEAAYWQVYHDTSSDDFQIVVELREVFWKYAQRRDDLDSGTDSAKDGHFIPDQPGKYLCSEFWGGEWKPYKEVDVYWKDIEIDREGTTRPDLVYQSPWSKYTPLVYFSRWRTIEKGQS